MLNRNSIGIEKEKKYLNIIEKRLNEPQKKIEEYAVAQKIKLQFLYIFDLIVILPQIAFSQSFGEGRFGEGPFGGEVRNSSDPKIPFVIGLKVYYNNKPLNHTLTRIKNLNTDEFDEQFTNEFGESAYNLANFKIRYLQGDIIEIRVCLNDDRCKEDIRNYTVTDGGGIMANFRLSDKQDNVITSPIENSEVKQPIQDVLNNSAIEVIYLNNTTIIDRTKYIDNSTNTVQYISQYFIHLVNKNFTLVIELVVGITLIGITIRRILKLIKKKSQYKILYFMRNLS